MRKINLIGLFILAFVTQVYSQEITISGYVYCASTGEKLLGANIYNAQTKKGTSSNNYGFYSLNVQKNDSVNIIISYTGYSSQIFSLNSNINIQKNFELQAGKELDEFEIIGSNNLPIEQETKMSVVSIPIKQIQSLPAIGGESDIIKAIQLMPGIQSGSEGSSGLYVRGGNVGQNLILIDDVPLYYVNHLGGFVSTFNTDAINTVSLTKGGFPAHYGGRLSSVMDVRMKEGNTKETHGSVMLGLIAAKAHIEGPIKQDTTSYIVSFRRLLYDLISRPISKMATGNSVGYNFYDFNAKLNHMLNQNNRIYGSFYMGDDKAQSKSKTVSESYIETYKYAQKWGNIAGSLRWNHLFNQKLFSNITLSYTRYRFLADMLSTYEEENVSEEYFYNFNSGVQDLSFKMDFDYNVSTNYRMKFGILSVYHTFKPETRNYGSPGLNSTQLSTSLVNSQLSAWEHAVYLENIFNIGSKLCFNVGLRTALYKENIESYYSFEPRLLANFRINKTTSAKASYAKMQQNIHLLTSSGADMPVNLWFPATDKIPPSSANQWAIGLAKSYKNGLYELSLEGYYKEMNNLITYKEGLSYLGSSTLWEDKVEKDGLGKSYGLELLFQKKLGKATGWIGYTLSKTNRQFENINNGEPYAYRFDRRHDLSIALNHKLKENVDLSATWIFGTGNAFTMAVGKYYTPDNTEIHIYEGKNTFRMRSYHRLDVGVNFHKKKKRGERTWSLSIYNLYNRENPYYYFFDTKESSSYLSNETAARVVKQNSLFPFIPSVSYSFKF